ncbi:thiamine biosynthesis protein ApbE [Stutzerimonas stutzeri]|uniref:FAD:protein FMN transferase n=1 Tax=Stutzerimonas stutzeri TaxID=316 RepID=W8RRY9_STUST|nr:FAD:protein FMN transferase [Stutzerimonas stutzeri]AHL74816.1 thiamine biosynthesis protein ApbE [Stutzerimonas stutzeri]MCQ4329348.1 FAD:protein FMN transferase [Stutzerimonas stutzeri]
MGSTYTVKYVAGREASDKEQLQRETESILAEIDRQLSTYRADSDIERFNALSAGECMTMPDGVRELILAGQQLSDESDGALDLTIEPLLNLWGFGPQGRGERVPSAEEIATARQNVGQHHLRVDGEQLCKDRAVQVDFNSIAAGYAVDQVATALEASGVDSYLVEITGELKARGRKPDGSSWRVAIEAPRDNERVAQRIIELDGFAVSTSGDYRNYFERDGKRYSHTLDPQTGAPIIHHLAAVTVVDPSTLRADGLSTVLMVMGPERGLAYATERKIAAFFVVREGQEFLSRSTEAFDELFGAGAEQ